MDSSGWGQDHSLATTEWIAAKSDGLFDNSENITPERIMLFVNKWWGVVPSYRKCYKAKEMLVEKIEGNHDASFAILPPYGVELKRANPGLFY